ncbi:hypothetical protein M426DRAFT_24693 [Hypoxylon sp. CI-4A]|nr:hypothetical protein M426DRAFT_24693 [Hypoxylon sp. CI-4A]
MSHSTDEKQRFLEAALAKAEAWATKSEAQNAELVVQNTELAVQKARTDEQIQKTTCSEYVTYGHKLFDNFNVQQDERLTTTGTTDPTQKFCPNQLQLWESFTNEQDTIQAKISGIYQSPQREFDSKHFLETLGRKVSNKHIANEKDLEYILHLILEDPVRNLVYHLKDLDSGCPFDIEDGVLFENHPNAISDNSDEVRERQQQDQTPQRSNGSSQPSAFGNLKADQICVYKSNKDSYKRSIAYIIEYKAPHKLTKPQLRAGLCPMDIAADIINDPYIPQFEDTTKEFAYHARKLVAAVIAQTFHYMIEAGLEYSYLTTGEAIVFLHINWKDPRTLYYHLAEPAADVSDNPDQLVLCTAISQVLAFTLLAFEAKKHGQDTRNEAQKKLQKLVQDPEEVLRRMPPSVRKVNPDDTPFPTPRSYKKRELLFAPPRSPKPRRARPVRSGDGVPERDPNPDPSDSDSDPTQASDTPTKRPANYKQGRQKEHPSDPKPRGDGGNAQESSRRQYCTQNCLVGLVNMDLLDLRCPNVMLHQSEKDKSFHPVTHKTWLRLLREQLHQTLDDGVVSLGKQGARGVLFQVTLLRYGYTFVGKGTVPEFVRDLQHESTIYRHLWPLQGVSVPVFLGEIDLRGISRTYYYDHRVYIIYMMFLSWGGEMVEDAEARLSMGKDPSQEVVRSVQALHDMGVAHTDVRRPNVLWNEENQRVMVIDFERAILTTIRPRSSNQMARNKRRITQEATSPGPLSTLYIYPDTRVNQVDLALAKSMF